MGNFLLIEIFSTRAIPTPYLWYKPPRNIFIERHIQTYTLYITNKYLQ